MAKLLHRSAGSLSSSVSVHRISDGDRDGEPEANWDGMIEWGTDFQNRTGITPQDIDRIVEEVRRDRK